MDLSVKNEGSVNPVVDAQSHATIVDAISSLEYTIKEQFQHLTKSIIGSRNIARRESLTGIDLSKVYGDVYQGEPLREEQVGLIIHSVLRVYLPDANYLWAYFQFSITQLLWVLLWSLCLDSLDSTNVAPS